MPDVCTMVPCPWTETSQTVRVGERLDIGEETTKAVSILDHIGNTPLLKLNHVVDTPARAVHKALAKFGVPELRFLIEDLLDGNVTVGNAEAKRMADRLCREEGLYCGMSSGANVYAAIEMAKTMKKGSRIVTVVVDRRDRYLAEYPNEHYVV